MRCIKLDNIARKYTQIPNIVYYISIIHFKSYKLKYYKKIKLFLIFFKYQKNI